MHSSNCACVWNIRGTQLTLDRNQRRRVCHDSGFSFIEVMVVVVIIGILAGTVSLATRHMIAKARHNRARTDIATYVHALEAFHLDYGRYPDAGSEGLAALVPAFIAKVTADPWGRPYQYHRPGPTSLYEVASFGADGKGGGEGADADVFSWQLDKELTGSSTNKSEGL